MLYKYLSLIKLTGRDNGRSFYFTDGIVTLRVIPYQSAEDMENPPHGIFFHGPQLGEWGGNLVVPFGTGIQKHLDLYWMETEKHRGNIWLVSAEILDSYVDVEFRGSGDLISVKLETELKKMLYVPPRP